MSNTNNNKCAKMTPKMLPRDLWRPPLDAFWAKIKYFDPNWDPLWGAWDRPWNPNRPGD